MVLKEEIAKVIQSRSGQPEYEIKYDSAFTETVQNVVALDIEREYLYWTNTNAYSTGAIHKAFTEPFLVNVPFQSYVNEEVNSATNIESNEHFLFYTGDFIVNERQDGNSKLFVQKKKGADSYLTFEQSKTESLYNPKGILSYRDTRLLISNQGFISQLDVTHYPPNYASFSSNNVFEFKDQNQSPTVGMTFITKSSEAVHMVTLSSSAVLTTSLIATAIVTIFF